MLPTVSHESQFPASQWMSRVIELPIDQISHEIKQCLEHVHCDLRLLQSGLMEYSEDSQALLETHSFRTSDEKPPPNHPRAITDAFPYLMQNLTMGHPLAFSDPTTFPEEAVAETRIAQEIVGAESVLLVPLRADTKVIGTFWLCYSHPCYSLHRVLERLRPVLNVFSVALHRRLMTGAMKKLTLERNEFDELSARDLRFLDEMKLEHIHEGLVGHSNTIREVLMRVEQVAPTSSSVLITGETGTGKELLARAIHGLSPRKNRHMVKLNCSSIPQTLFEAELFGHEKGAFSGAIARRMGRFEAADGSTIFLDEIGDLPLELQPKLLRVLEEGEFERLGSSKTSTTNVRVIAATNRDIPKAVQSGEFREDLYHRLNVFPISVPPLRERLEDIPELVKAFILELGGRTRTEITAIPNKSLKELESYHWPGNIRELKNLVERSMIASKSNTLRLTTPKITGLDPSVLLSLDDLQRQHILRALKKTGGRVFGERGAAKLLDINPKTLQSRMRKLGIQRSDR